jgi:hypothetical protein
VVVHAAGEVSQLRPGDRAYMVDPTWRAWDRSDGVHGYPPFGEVGGTTRASGHALYELIRRSHAIISKPGGGTLIDSLSSATPVVLLEPYGYAEAKNGALWEELGYGISFAKWRDAGFSTQQLEQLHDNLVRRSVRGDSYPQYYADQLHARRP